MSILIIIYNLTSENHKNILKGQLSACHEVTQQNLDDYKM